MGTRELEIPPEGIDLNQATEDLERKLIERALQITVGNRSKAARLLGITLRSLRYRLVKLGLDQDEIAREEK
jgi:two-component system response regulator PilR (NtrC family)